MLPFLVYSFKLTAAGDPYTIIPETISPQIRERAPYACVVIMSDDIQHKRLKVEMNRSQAQSQRLIKS